VGRKGGGEVRRQIGYLAEKGERAGFEGPIFFVSQGKKRGGAEGDGIGFHQKSEGKSSMADVARKRRGHRSHRKRRKEMEKEGVKGWITGPA